MLAVSGYSLLKFNSFLPPHGGLFHCSNLSRCTGEGMIDQEASFHGVLFGFHRGLFHPHSYHQHWQHSESSDGYASRRYAGGTMLGLVIRKDGAVAWTSLAWPPVLLLEKNWGILLSNPGLLSPLTLHDPNHAHFLRSTHDLPGSSMLSWHWFCQYPSPCFSRVALKPTTSGFLGCLRFTSLGPSWITWSQKSLALTSSPSEPYASQAETAAPGRLCCPTLQKSLH